MPADKVPVDLLRRFEPIRAFSEARLQELAALCVLQTVAEGQDPFRSGGMVGEVAYLVDGEICLKAPNGEETRVRGGTEEARFPLGKRPGRIASARAVSRIQLVRIDEDLLDIMSTWDQVAEDSARGTQLGQGTPALANWTIMSGMFSVSNLKYGAFSQLPAANIDELLNKFRRIDVKSGQVLIREGSEGDYYYVIESGKCRVERMIGGVCMLLAELKSGDAFGEEALVSEAKRNATITMKVDGTVLRLGKHDFNDLLKEPLLHRVSLDEARQRVAMGGQWIDVRYPSEYQYDKLPGAINIPLAEVRNAFDILNKAKDYVVYCQSERRSSAAAFLLAQRGYKAYLLGGGLWNNPASRT